MEEHVNKVGTRDLLLLVLWFGVLFGAVEVVALGVIKFGSLASAPAGWASPDDRLRHSYLWLSPHVIWMAPVMLSAFLALPATLLGTLGRFKAVLLSLRTVVGVMTFVCAVSLLYIYPRLYDWAVVLLAGGLAVQAGRVAGARTAGLIRLVRRTAKWMAAAVVIAAVVMNVGSVVREKTRLAGLSAPLSDAPNVLLLILDTVRAANLSVYGYPRKTTPNLEQLAENGVTFDRAIATSPWTLPSHVSMFTGRLPYEFNTNFLIPYAGEHRTLAEHLSSRGYMTAGFSGNLVYCAYEAGITRGFLHYKDYRVVGSEFLIGTALGRRIARSQGLHNLLGRFDVFGEKDAATVTREFLRWVDRRPRERPFFAFLNYMDAHEPYLPPQRFQERFGTDTERRNDVNTYFIRWAARPGRELMTADEVRAELGAYDGTIAYVDEQVGILLAHLRDAGVLENTVVIVASDHGEQFGEHGLHVHGNSLFLPALHVPLIMAYGDRLPAGTRVPEPASIRDIPETVLGLAGLVNGSPFPGESLERYWRAADDSAVSPMEPVFSELTDIRGAPTVKSILVGRYHYIWGENRIEALFDIEADPEESTSLVKQENVELVGRMRRLMAPHIRNDAALWERLPQSGDARQRR
jgi:arylsulfatase A-like enzyme